MSPVKGEVVQVRYRVDKREKKYWCYESVELKTNEEVPELLTWVQVRIDQDWDGSELFLCLYQSFRYIIHIMCDTVIIRYICPTHYLLPDL